MHNLDQIRAENALVACGLKSAPAARPAIERVAESAVTKLPALIVNNGLLAAAAFAQKKGEEMLRAMNAVAWHLADHRVHRLPANCTTTRGLAEHLALSESQDLRLASSEALSFLSYMKRYAP
jgi:CRISPR type III-B/RAMP module-associated protein Cmr5